ncbi:MerR family transcriptional regulator [Bacillus sp. V3-13]|uniref:MerR family transcriptional regulator n=1 Tax=Bacillus sp. V3-13 TaxID=2053728 RepID=UPI000C78422A|nr:MerR family transcriptional regulator [Bacillus sp. V3-13]PLR77548.1 MerR family transcriptional regulator [Bacillus sp. V3-13]
MYRIGELARRSNVSKRTIDYYTGLGLLQAQRSDCNYRIYTEEALNDLKFIEECKKMHLPLEEIKRKLEIKKSKDIRESEVEKHIDDVTSQMKQLHNELSTILPLIEKLEGQQKKKLSNKLSTESTALMQSLLILTS